MTDPNPHYVSTRNPCRLCTPFGATLAMAGVEGSVPLLHGSQGCSTYIRRYLIGHFREPMDVASSNFHENAAVFGGRENLHKALTNVIDQYRPDLIGVATTCLAETIGDDVPMFLHEFRRAHASGELPALIPVSTPSYRGSHTDGFTAAIRELVRTLAEPGPVEPDRVNLLGAMVCPDDLRYLSRLAREFGLRGVVLPDYADRLDGPTWEEYRRIPSGGTPLSDIRASGRAAASLEFTHPRGHDPTAGRYLADEYGVSLRTLPLPIGIRNVDALMDALCGLSGGEVPSEQKALRGRLVDAMVDAHKYLFGRRVIMYGETEWLVALVGFLGEVGLVPILVAAGERSSDLRRQLATVAPEHIGAMTVLSDTDFADIDEYAESVDAELIVGSSNGLKLSRRLQIPLVRVGMPIHDRLGAARMRVCGYDGTLRLLDDITNTLIAARQDACDIGYTHM